MFQNSSNYITFKLKKHFENQNHVSLCLGEENKMGILQKLTHIYPKLRANDEISLAIAN